MNFDGVDDYIEIFDSPDLDLDSTSYTIAAWVRINCFGCSSEYQQSVVSKRNTFSSNQGYHLVYNEDDYDE